MGVVLRMYVYNVVCILFFANTLHVLAKRYGTEKDKRNFNSYEHASYYTIVTHFTVGLGDIAPESAVLRRLTMLQIVISFHLLSASVMLSHKHLWST